jgi:hypothetical protein
VALNHYVKYEKKIPFQNGGLGSLVCVTKFNVLASTFLKEKNKRDLLLGCASKINEDDSYAEVTVLYPVQ